MRISFIGSGNVAHHLAHYLSKSNEVIQICSRSLENAQILANKVNAKAISEITSLEEVDLLIIAVNDDQIETLSKAIELKNSIIVHTSGTKSIDLLKGHKAYGLLYPLQTFTKDRVVDFAQIPVFVEGSNQDVLSSLSKIAEINFPNVHHIDFEQRQKLHVGAVMVNNFVNHLIAQTDQFLEQNAMDMAYLKPLIQETIAKIDGFKAKDIQTGPAIRRDQQTINRHLDLIEDNSMKSIYEVMTKCIQEFTS